jgi:hypothetical protein
MIGLRSRRAATDGKEAVKKRETAHSQNSVAAAWPGLGEIGGSEQPRSIDAQRGYRPAIEEFIEWYCSQPRLSLSKTVVLRYPIHLESRHLAPGTINLRLGAVRRLAYEASDCGLLRPDLAGGIRRVKGVKKIGVRLGNWLTPEHSQRLWNAPDAQKPEG